METKSELTDAQINQMTSRIITYKYGPCWHYPDWDKQAEKDVEFLEQNGIELDYDSQGVTWSRKEKRE